MKNKKERERKNNKALRIGELNFITYLRWMLKTQTTTTTTATTTATSNSDREREKEKRKRN
jgi:hypothetical protein